MKLQTHWKIDILWYLKKKYEKNPVESLSKAAKIKKHATQQKIRIWIDTNREGKFFVQIWKKNSQKSTFNEQLSWKDKISAPSLWDIFSKKHEMILLIQIFSRTFFYINHSYFNHTFEKRVESEETASEELN